MNDGPMHLQLFAGERVRLTAFEPAQDAEVQSRWTHDPEYLRLLGAEPARPLSAAQIKAQHEADEKEKNHRRLMLAVRAVTLDAPGQPGERLIGFARLDQIEWNHGNGWLQLGIGAAADRRQGYGTDALRVLLRYIFDELNFHRASARVIESNLGARRLFERAGFQEEARRREAIYRDGRRWDELFLGVLRAEWERRA